MAGKKAQKGRKRIDWEAVERDYRTGKFTLRELEAKHKVGYASISRRAKDHDWQKDLREAVKLATDAALMADIATKSATEAQHATLGVVAVAAEVNKQVILRHRGDIAETRNLAMELLAEIRLATHSQGELESLMRMASAGLGDEDLTAVRQALNDLVKVHSRVGSVQKLADTLNKLQTLERRAFGIEEGEKSPGEGGGPLVVEFVRAS